MHVSVSPCALKCYDTESPPRLAPAFGPAAATAAAAAAQRKSEKFSRGSFSSMVVALVAMGSSLSLLWIRPGLTFILLQTRAAFR